MSLGRRVFLLLVTLVTLATGLQPVAADAMESGDCARLVDIGGGRKMYLKCRGTGSPTVVLVGGLRASAEDWSIASKSTSALQQLILPQPATRGYRFAADAAATAEIQRRSHP